METPGGTAPVLFMFTRGSWSVARSGSDRQLTERPLLTWKAVYARLIPHAHSTTIVARFRLDLVVPLQSCAIRDCHGVKKPNPYCR